MIFQEYDKRLKIGLFYLLESNQQMNYKFIPMYAPLSCFLVHNLKWLEICLMSTRELCCIIMADNVYENSEYILKY